MSEKPIINDESSGLINTSTHGLYGSTNAKPDEGPASSSSISPLIEPLKKQWNALRKEKIRLVLLYSVIAAVGALLNGFNLGYIAFAQIDIKNIATLGSGSYPSDDQFMYIGGALNVGALIAGLITGVVSDKLGRKMTLLIATIPSAIGWAIIASSFWFINENDSTDVMIMLIVGRAVAGFATGAFSLVVPVYIIEISPTDLKGLFGALNQFAVTIGILIIYALTSLVDYYIVALIAAGVTLLFAVSILFLVETPRWLITSHERLKANAVLYYLRGSSANIVSEMNVLEKAIEKEAELSVMDKLKIFGRKSSLFLLFMSICLMFFQQFCGINIIIFYAGKVLLSAELDQQTAEYAANFGVGALQVLITFVSVLTIDMVGRRILLIAGGILMFISTAMMGTYFYLQEHHEGYKSNPIPSPVAVVCLAVFIVGFSLGWGAVPWVMMGELASPQIRGIITGIATFFNWTFSAIVTFNFNFYSHAVQVYGAWWTFAGVIMLSVVFTIVLLPETKGENLEDIEEYFQYRYRVCNWWPCRKTSSSSDTAIDDNVIANT
jgi:sugar porter (SP) family MFS transporter